MHLNLKALGFTIVLYLVYLLVVFLTNKFYTPRAANDITGPPFLVMIVGVLVILLFFFRSIYLAYSGDSSYWSVVILHVILIFVLVYRFAF